jgi:hypothetical protein
MAARSFSSLIAAWRNCDSNLPDKHAPVCWTLQNNCVSPKRHTRESLYPDGFDFPELRIELPGKSGGSCQLGRNDTRIIQ